MCLLFVVMLLCCTRYNIPSTGRATRAAAAVAMHLVTITPLFSIFFSTSLLLSSSTPGRFYPQRSSGHAVVTGFVPSPPRYMPSILSRIGVQHSHCSSIFIVASLRSRAFRQSVFYARSPYEYVHSVIIELAKLILVGTRTTHQATGDAGYIWYI